MEYIKVLFYFIAEDKTLFLELKNLNNKESDDKSKYVSWFRIIDNIPKRLNFLKMEKNIRFFKEGQIIIDGKNTHFIENNSLINLTEKEIDNQIVKKCFECWN